MDSRPPSNASIAALVTGILSDVRDLVSVELKIAWAEFQQELRQARVSAAAFAVSVGLILLGTLLLMQMLVQLLHASFSWPLWACFGAVGLFGVVLGAILMARAKW